MRRFIVELPVGEDAKEVDFTSAIRTKLEGSLDIDGELHFFTDVSVEECSLAPEALAMAARDGVIDEDVEIDDGANMSVGEDGAWVSAWVFVPAKRAFKIPGVQP